jgi:DNA-binding beta-propeller fold protein YncE
VPALRALRQRFPDELVVIGIHTAKFPSEHITANIRAAVLRHGIQHPVANDTGYKVWESYAVRAWPTLILVDPRGKIAYEVSGEVLASELIPQIERLIAEYDQAGLLDRRPLHFTPERDAQPAQSLSFPARVLPDGERLFVADSGHHRILELRLDSAGESAQVQRVFGTGEAGLVDGSAAQAQFYSPHGLALAGEVLYAADTENHAIRSIDLQSGVVKTLAGTGEKSHGRFQFKLPTETPLRSPWDVLAVGPDQPGENPIVFIAMAGSHQIWILLEDGRLGVFAGNGREALVDGPLGDASFNQPSGLAFGMGHLFVADPEASAIRALSLGEHAQVLTLVGRGLFDYGDRDGVGQAVRLQHPAGVAYADGQVYIADSYNHKIKVLDPSTGEVHTLIGSGEAGCKDGAFNEAALYQPEGLAVQAGRIYIADTNNHVIRTGDLKSQRLATLTLNF